MIPADLDEARPDVERIVEITSRPASSPASAIGLARKDVGDVAGEIRGYLGLPSQPNTGCCLPETAQTHLSIGPRFLVRL
jgi:hypothetical protein